MNPIKIEKGAIEALKRTIRLHDRMDEFLQSNDKEPSWDGDIYLYSDSDLKSEHIEYIVQTQVKGKNDEGLLKRNRITYPVKYKDLRNYRNNGGVCYFVIVISDNGEKTTVFYSALTPIKLESFLKGAEYKEPEQTKNIVLLKLKNNDKNELHKVLLQFGHDSKEQGTGELVRRAISIEDIPKIDSIRLTTFVSNNEEIMNKMTSGEACLFGHLSDADIWLPFAYDTQIKMNLIPYKRIDETFGVDEQVFYDSYELTKNKEGNFIVRLSENLSINMGTSKFNFKPITEIEKIMKDIQFLKALQQGSTLYVGKRKVADYGNTRFDTELQELIYDVTELYLATTKYEIDTKKRFDCFTEDDWRAIDELVKLHQGKIRPKNETAWHIWRWQGKVIPFFIVLTNNGEVHAENSLCMKKYVITAQGKKGEYRVPAFINFKRDVWENLYDVNENELLKELEKSEINDETEGNFSLLFVEILSAYDVTKNGKYFDISRWISDKLLSLNPDNDYWRINRLQILRRKRGLSEEELQELERMEERAEESKLLCAISILLENKRKAKKQLENMSEDDKKVFTSYPIYNLL